MEYKFLINDFEGPLDLLLHLIKKNNVDICDIKISDITKQYLDYLEEMENLDLNIASEYLALAAELIEMKSLVLLPKPEFSDDEYEFDNLYIKNYTNNNEVKTLYFVIDKSSTIKGDNISIIINNKEYELKKTLKQEENNKTLFKLDDFTIDAYNSINLETKVLLDKNTDVSDDDTLEISFEVK